MQEAKVEYNNLKFGKVGDWFKGVLTANSRQIRNQLSKEHEMQTIFEFKALGGSFHDIVKRQVAATPTIPTPGEFWSYITSKPSLLKTLGQAKLGQQIGLRFASSKPSQTPGQDDAKIISVMLGDMDPNYQGETAGDAGGPY